MSLKGSLQTVNLADILQVIGFGQKSGTFKIMNPPDEGRIYFKNGNIINASISNRTIDFGELIVKKGMIKKDDLEKLRKIAKSKNMMLYTYLTQNKLCEENELYPIIQSRVLDLCFEIFTWAQGEFEFLPDIMPENSEFELSEGVNNLIMEGSRRIDEFERIKDKIPSKRVILKFADKIELKLQHLKLKEQEKEILSIIDGQKSVNDIIQSVSMDELEVEKILYALIFANIIKVISESEQEEISEYIDLGDFYIERELTEDSLEEYTQAFNRNPYNIYVINQIAKLVKENVPDEVKKVFLQSEFNYLTLPDLTNESQKMLQQLMKERKVEKIKAAETPVAEKKIEEKPELKPEPVVKPKPEVKPEPVVKPELKPTPKPVEKSKVQPKVVKPSVKGDFMVLYYRGVKFFKSESYLEAIQNFARALKLKPNFVNCYTMIGNSYYKLKDLKNTVKYWEKSLEIEPGNVKLKKSYTILKKKIGE